MHNKGIDGKFCEVMHDKYHKGYRVIYKPDHPHSRMNGYVYEHILVMEEKIGRLLDNEEVVHHIDGNKLNNDPDNLMLFSNNNEHMKHHWKNRRHKYTLKNGDVVTIEDLTNITGLSYSIVYQRLNKLSWTAEEVLHGKHIAEDVKKNG